MPPDSPYAKQYNSFSGVDISAIFKDMQEIVKKFKVNIVIPGATMIPEGPPCPDYIQSAVSAIQHHISSNTKSFHLEVDCAGLRMRTEGPATTFYEYPVVPKDGKHHWSGREIGEGPPRPLNIGPLRSSLLSKFNIPVRYFNNCNRELQSLTINCKASAQYYYHSQRTVVATRSVQTVEGAPYVMPRCLAFQATNYKTSTNVQKTIPPVLLEMIPELEDVNVEGVSLKRNLNTLNGSISVSVYFDHLRVEHSGHYYTPVLVVKNSDVGEWSFTIQPGVLQRSVSSSYNYFEILSKQGRTLWRHNQYVWPDCMRDAVKRAFKQAQVALYNIISSSETINPWDHANLEKLVGQLEKKHKAVGNRLASILEEQSEADEELDRLAAISKIMQAVKDLPALQREEIHATISDKLQLMPKNTKRLHEIHTDFDACSTLELEEETD